MDSRKYVLRQTLILAIGEAVCVGLMLGIFALLNQFDSSVLLGGLVGGLMTVANFFFMAIGASLAADKAEQQNIKGGQAIVRGSYLLRTVILFIVLFAFAKSGLCNVISLVVPLAFIRPVLFVSEFFCKKGVEPA